jgi:peptide/nickel transport system ATP-binding protein
MKPTSILEVSDLNVHFVGDRPLHVVRKVSFSVNAGETHGIIGESGSGKSVTAFAIAQLLPFNARVSGDIFFQGARVGDMSVDQVDMHRGKGWAVIFQDPSGSFNPVKTVGWHLRGVLQQAGEQAHDKDARSQTLLREVGIRDAERVLSSYPFQLSGGMLQRVLIAMVQAMKPALIIADEPTTNLDKVIENQILDLLAQARNQLDAGVLLITHDLSLARRHCDDISVMYAGEIVETGPATELLDAPAHPYTRALLASARSLTDGSTRLQEIRGEVVSAVTDHRGCPFAPRCASAMSRCSAEVPPSFQLAAKRSVRCWLHVDTRVGEECNA